MNRIGGLIICVLAVAVSCTTRDYETGDSRYSYLRADFVDLHLSEPGKADYALTDEGTRLDLSPGLRVSWAAESDTLCRALLYYNADGKGIAPVSMSRVPLLHYVATSRTDTLHQDPLSLESAWVSANGRYLNLALIVKTGAPDSIDRRQHLALALDTLTRPGRNLRTLHLVLSHNQNNVPEYYSQKFYVSMPLHALPPHQKIHLSLRSYKGEVDRWFSY